MANRVEEIATFLDDTPWVHWEKTPLAGDASSRRYLRLRYKDQSVILMDADPALGQQTVPFLMMAAWLDNQGLAAPSILKSDTDKGLLLLEDLGPAHMAQHIHTHPGDTKTVYAAATDVLISLDHVTPPDGLHLMTAVVGGQMLDVTLDWYANALGDNQLVQSMTAHLADLCGAPDTVALRDYHAENLIWRPHVSGLAKVGLLDFQDAFIAPRGYDLVSLLRDVRRVVDPAICAAMTKRFESAVTPFRQGAFACLAVQRNLRILGVFARLALRDGKHRYITMIPHLWTMITEDIRDPALGELAKVWHSTLPPPEESAIKDLL